MTNPAVGDEKYIGRGDSNTDGSVRLLYIADADGDGLPDAKLQHRSGGAWADLGQAGTQAVAGRGTVHRTIADRAKDVADLRDWITSTADRAAIEAAITSPPTLSGDITSQVQAALDNDSGFLRVQGGVIPHGKLTLTKGVFLYRGSGTGGTSDRRPKFWLQDNTNDHGWVVPGGTKLWAREIDFWGNLAGQSSGTSDVIHLSDALVRDTYGLVLEACNVRSGKNKGIYAGLLRSVGFIGGLKGAISDNGEDGIYLLDIDWNIHFQEIGSNGWAGIYCNADSNNAGQCDIYSNGTDSGSSRRSGVYLGPLCRLFTLNGGQVNDNNTYGIECVGTGQSSLKRNTRVVDVDFQANSAATPNTYSDIKVTDWDGFTEVGCTHSCYVGLPWTPKYLFETAGTTARLTMVGVSYDFGGFSTGITNDPSKVTVQGAKGYSLADSHILQAKHSTNDRWLSSYSVTGGTIDANEKLSDDVIGIRRRGAGGASAVDTATLRTTADQFGMASGDSFKLDGTWNGGRYYAGTRQTWDDASGNRRRKNGTPTADTDGTIVSSAVVA